MDPGDRPAILVLGMHRSGTSALTRVLNLMGVALGENLLPAHQDNEAGFWEHREIVLLHDELLAALGSRWDDPAPLDAKRLHSAEMRPYRTRLREILERDFAEAPVFGVKDPRVCRLVPLWCDVLEEMGRVPRFVLTARDPREVAASLAKRNGFDPEFSQLLWLEHTLSAERDTRGRPRTFVTFDSLLEDWRAAAVRMADDLGLDWSEPLATSGDAVDAFLQPSLRHHRTESEAAPLPTLARELWEAFPAAARGDDAALRLAADRAGAEMSGVGSLLGWLVRETVAQRRHADRLRQLLDKRAAKIVDLRAQLGEAPSNAAPAVAPAAEESTPEEAPSAEGAAEPSPASESCLDRPGTRVVRNYEAPEGQPRVSIVIPLFNQVELTAKCLESLAEHTESGTFEVILVDNASSDATPDLLGCLEGNVKIVVNETNLGFATACNQGAGLASTDRILFLNNDVEAKPGWLPPLLQRLDDDPSIGIVGSKLLFPDGKIQHAGVALLHRLQGSLPLGAFHVHYGEAADHPDANVPLLMQVVTGACLMARRGLFEDIGGFDTYYWNGCEDVDFCLQARVRGWKVLYEPQSELVHHESMSGPQRFARTGSNEKLLCSRWFGRVEPDLTETAEGDRGRSPRSPIAPYEAPERSPEAVGSAAGDAPDRLTSIVILTRNGLEDLRPCLESIERNTPEPHEIVVVDNGSTDGTREWLDTQLDAMPLRVVRNDVNRGFAGGNNQGLALARGHQVVLLNNDTVVPAGWLGSLTEVLDEHPDCGIVGPMTNRASGPQVIADVPYQTLDAMEKFAVAWGASQEGSALVNRLVGFCWLMRREVVQDVGGLDERFGSGNFEDDDFCLRARQAGWTARIANAAFVHHVGSRTFVREKIDYEALMVRNFGLFCDKWGLDPASTDGRSYPAAELVKRPAQPAVRLPELTATHTGSRESRWFEPAAGAAVATEDTPPTLSEAPAMTDSSTHRLAAGLLPAGDVTDGTRALFTRHGFADEPPVWNTPAAIGMQTAAHPLVLLLGPDVVVPEAALQEMVGAMHAHPDLAAVGPESNAAPRGQRGSGTYSNLDRDLRRFAEKRRRRKRGLLKEVPHLGGFCLLLRSTLVNQAGGLEGDGPIDEALLDLFVRLREAGGRVAVARGAWVHHQQLDPIEGAHYDSVEAAAPSA